MWVLRQVNAYIIGFLGTQNRFLENGFLNLNFDPGILGSIFRILRQSISEFLRHIRRYYEEN